MNIKEAIHKNSVRIDFNEEILFSEDQVYLDYPEHFPTVNVALVDTYDLCRIADEIRMEKGFLPFFPEDENTEYCYDGFYNFYYGFNGYTENRMDKYIIFSVQCDGAEDDWEEYTIEIDEASQSILKAALESQLKEHDEKSVEELLQEAREEMEK